VREISAGTLAALLLVAGVAALAPSGAAAEIKKMMTPCPGQKLCAWFQSTVVPPKGWIEDKEGGQQRHVTILVPDKPELVDRDPLIYVQTSYHPGSQTLDAIVAGHQAQWLESESEGSATPIGAAPRAAALTPSRIADAVVDVEHTHISATARLVAPPLTLPLPASGERGRTAPCAPLPAKRGEAG